jgi:tetratricopeptide (TPR) repeat protein
MSMASPPVLFLDEIDEIAFTRQSPAPLFVPPTPRQYLHDTVQEEDMVIAHREGGGLDESHTRHLAQDHRAQPLLNTSTPFPPSCIGTDLLQDHPSEEGDEFGTNIDPYLNALSSLGQFGPTVFSVTDPSIFGKFKVASTQTETLKNMHELAEGFFFQGKYKAAEKVYRQILQLRQELFPPKHLDTLNSMNKLADTIFHQGRYKTAEKMHREVLQLRHDVLGANHPDTLNSTYALATVLRHQGRYNSAEEILQRTLDDHTEVLGEANHWTLNCMFELAIVLYRQGEEKVAEEMYRRVLSKEEELRGKDSLDTLKTVSTLAQILRDQGKHGEAEEMFQRVLRETREEAGERAPRDTLGRSPRWDCTGTTRQE